MTRVLEEAQALRRKGRFREALRLVSPLVYVHGRFRPQRGAIAEYALNLAQLGAPEAAEAILLRSPERAHEERFALALCLILQWRHAEATPLLEDVRAAGATGATTDAARYAGWVALANLLWCHLYTGRTEDVALLYAEAEPALARHPVLHANAWTTLTKAVFLHRLRTGAPLAPHLQPSRVNGRPPLSPYDDLALRFAASLEAALPTALPTALRACVRPNDSKPISFAALAQEGRDKGLFEFARECALWDALLESRAPSRDLGGTRAPQILLIEGWGTPYPGFRAFARRVSGWMAEGAHDTPQDSPSAPQACYVSGRWLAFPSEGASAVDPWSDDALALSPTERGLLATLVRDTHRPATHERLHLETHPRVPFLPESSPAAVNVALSRLRAKFRRAGYDWDVVAVPDRGFALRVEHPPLVVPARLAHRASAAVCQGPEGDLAQALLPRDWDAVLSRLPSAGEADEAGGVGGVSRAHLEKETGVHARTLTRVLAGLVEAGLVTRRGRGPATAYALKAAPTEARAAEGATSAPTP